MHTASYYRRQAARTRWLAHFQSSRANHALLERVARDFDELAEDLELSRRKSAGSVLAPRQLRRRTTTGRGRPPDHVAKPH